MSALAQKLRTIPPVGLVGYSAVILGAIWFVLGTSFFIGMTVMTAEDDFDSSLLNLMVFGVFGFFFALLFIVPGLCGVVFGYRLIRQVTVNRIKFAVGSLVFMTANIFHIFLASPFDALIPYEIYLPVTKLCILPAALWAYALVCHRVVQSEGLGFDRPRDFLTNLVMLGAAFIVYSTTGTLFDAVAPERFRASAEAARGAMLIPRMVVPIFAAFAFYHYSVRFLNKQRLAQDDTLRQPPTLDGR